MLHFVDEGTGPPLVLVHGLAADLSQWAPITAPLSSSYRCVRVDLPGHGRSPDGGYGVLDQVAAVHEVVEHLGLERPALLGHSAGGGTATLYAVLHPTSCVVNVDQPLDLPGFAALIGDRSHWEDDFEAALEGFESSLGGLADLPSPLREELQSSLRPRQEVVLAWWADLFAGRAEELQAQLEAALPAISCPYLAVLGKEPSAVATRALSLIPHADAEVWPGRHFPHLADVTRFVARVRTLVP